MPESRAVSDEGPDLSRRDFLTKRLPGRLAAMLGGPPPATAAAARSEPDDAFSPRDLTRMSRDEVRAAVARIRGRERGAR